MVKGRISKDSKPAKKGKFKGKVGRPVKKYKLKKGQKLTKKTNKKKA